MSTDLIERVQQTVTLTRLQSGQLSFHRFTLLNGVGYILEMSKGKDVSFIKLDDFARAFHGTATKNTRRRAKQQLSKLIKFLIGEGWLVVPDYTDRLLTGMVWVRSIPDDDPEGIIEMVSERIATAEHRCDLGLTRLGQLKRNLRSITEESRIAERPPAV